MLKIRMQRIGRTNMPAYRVIVAEHKRGPKAGNIVEKVGTYNPKTKERQLNDERIKYWLSVGAKASDTVHNMLIATGIISGKKINVLPKKTVPAKDEEVETAAAKVPEADAESSAKQEVETAPTEPASAEAVAEPAAPEEQKQ